MKTVLAFLSLITLVQFAQAAEYTLDLMPEGQTNDTPLSAWRIGKKFVSAGTPAQAVAAARRLYGKKAADVNGNPSFIVGSVDITFGHNNFGLMLPAGADLSTVYVCADARDAALDAQNIPGCR